MARRDQQQRRHSGPVAAHPEHRAARRSPPRQSRPVLRFVVLFVLCLIISYLVSSLDLFQAHVFPSFLRWNASVSARLLTAMGQENIVASGSRISSPGFNIEIARGCDAVEPIALFVCAILATPVAWRTKLVGVPLGTLCLMLLNFVRIISLFLIGARWPAIFHLMHVDIWQALFILIAVALWVVWARWGLSRPQRGSVQK